MTKYESNQYINEIAEEFERVMEGDLKNNALINNNAYLKKTIKHFLKIAYEKHTYNYILSGSVELCECYKLNELKLELINLKKS